jgi:uncharacterized iron-regulated membrane protein
MTSTIDDTAVYDVELSPRGRDTATRTESGSAMSIRRLAMRPRRVLVKTHRWLSFVLMAWLVVISVTGAWLVVSDSVESWVHSERYATTSGDVGLQAATDAALAAAPEGSTVGYAQTQRNSRGVYKIALSVPIEGVTVAEGEAPPEEYLTFFVDPGSGEINDITNDEQGATIWLYRGHMYLWQDHGLFGVFDPGHGWCRLDAGGAEPGGVKGVVCDVIPDGADMVAWLAAGWMIVLFTGFYLWYWPGVRRWATALVVRRGRGRFAFHMSVHKLIGLIVWVPLAVIAFTGMAFAFPNMARWYDNVTPAQRDFALWSPPEDIVSGDAAGRTPLDLDDIVAVVNERYPDRAVEGITPPFDETGTYSAWVTRGFSPWTREGSAGNVYMLFDQYTGDTLYDGTPEEGNTFDQAWDDYSFPLHAGDFGGTSTRVLWFLIALSPLALGVTGIIMNRIRHRKRARRAGAAAESSTTPELADFDAAQHVSAGDQAAPVV